MAHRRNRNHELIERRQVTKSQLDALNLKATDRVTTEVAAGLLCKHPVTLRTWRCEGRGPPHFKDPEGKSVLYKVGDLWAWTEKNTVDPRIAEPLAKPAPSRRPASGRNVQELAEQ
jgi:hypothetical protein